MNKSIKELEMECRINVLKKMNEAIVNFDDEDVWDIWITSGVPDEPTEEEFEFVAENYEEYLEVITLFARLCERYGI